MYYYPIGKDKRKHFDPELDNEIIEYIRIHKKQRIWTVINNVALHNDEELVRENVWQLIGAGKINLTIDRDLELLIDKS
jgi:hypothetical protein